MPLYEYRCPECRTVLTCFTRTSRLPRACPHPTCVHPGPLHRVFGFSLKPVMQEHFNQTVGKPISSMQQFADELKRKSEEATLRTGIEHDYKPVDLNDREALGITGEGIDESNRVREKRGDPLLPDIT